MCRVIYNGTLYFLEIGFTFAIQLVYYIQSVKPPTTV